MKYNASAAYRSTFEEVDFKDIPNGNYKASFGGYEVIFKIGDSTYKILTKEGVRTFAASCTVSVLNGNVEVSI